MISPDVKLFDIQLEDPAFLFEKAREQLEHPEWAGNYGISHAYLTSLSGNTGLFSQTEADLVLYYPSGNLHRKGFALFLYIDYLTQELGCWSNSETSILQATLKRVSPSHEVAISQTDKSRIQNLFLFDRPLALRLHTRLGYKDNPHYRPTTQLSTTLTLDAGSTRSLGGSPDNIILPFDQPDDFIRKIQAGVTMMTTVVNRMIAVKHVSQNPKTLLLAASPDFYPV